MRPRGLLAVGLVLLAACGDAGDTVALEQRIAEQDQRIAELEAALDAATSTTAAATTTSATTTTTSVELSTAQRVYCEDLVSVIQVRTPTGGMAARPETVAFMQIAHELGYLTPPGGESPEAFIMKVYQDAGAWRRFVAPSALSAGWRAVLGGDVQLYEQAFRETCLQAWELR